MLTPLTKVNPMLYMAFSLLAKRVAPSLWERVTVKSKRRYN